MRKKTTVHNPRNTLRLLVIFCAVVIVAIVASLSYRLFNLIKTSKVEGVEKVAIAFINEPNVSIVGLDIKQKTASVISVSGEGNAQEKLKTLAITPDGTITLQENVDTFDKTSGLLWKAFFKRGNSKTTFSEYDLIRLALFSQGVAPSSVETEKIALPTEIGPLDQQLQSLLEDEKIAGENKSIAVINATGIPGVGRQLERIIANRGGNIIEVNNADAIQNNSVIRDTTPKSYTSTRLQTILEIPLEESERQDLSDIMVVIGKDSLTKF